MNIYILNLVLSRTLTCKQNYHNRMWARCDYLPQHNRPNTYGVEVHQQVIGYTHSTTAKVSASERARHL